MTLTHIAVFSAAALLYNGLIPRRWRGWLLLIASVLVIYWLQPPLPIRQLDFILPTAVLVMTTCCWLFVRPSAPFARQDVVTAGLVFILILLISATRYLVPELRLTSRPPDVPVVLFALLLAGAITLTGWQLSRRRPSARLNVLIALIVFIFILTKYEPLAIWLSSLLRQWQGQDVSLASPLDLTWLGFSYIAFRLIHTLRDYQTGQLPPLNLRAYLTYVIFFPAYTAGPIDRAERFVADFHDLPPLSESRLVIGIGRIMMGLFKKFVVADSLALIALDPISAGQVTSTAILWLLLYLYAFRLFFDFSGYSDIAIGIGILYGIQLPENFDRPYTKNTITGFWQSWHMTLSNWVRFYIFSPLSRWLLKRHHRPPTAVILLISHLATMTIIGLWHGIIHKMWTDRTRKWYSQLKQRPPYARVWHITGIILTFHFVLLGWVWFAVPDMDTAISILRRLFVQ
jgi:alginate O-acetyltransferase complex protein AlgI